MRKMIAALLCFTLAGSMVLAGCSAAKEGDVVSLGGPEATGELDGRATAAGTFGAALSTMADDGAEATGTAELNPAVTVKSLSGFYAGYVEAQSEYLKNLGTAIQQAQTGAPSDQVGVDLRYDSLDIAAHFYSVFAAWDAGEAGMEEVVAGWSNEPGWSGSLEKNGAQFTFVASLNGTPTYGWQGFWSEQEQYLYSYFVSADGTVMELDVIKTPYGYASQLYEPDYSALYRLSFCDDGSWNGAIVWDSSVAVQPELMTGEEALDIIGSSTWEPVTYYGDGPYWPQGYYVSGKVLTVFEGGGAMQYGIQGAGGASSNSSYNNNTNGNAGSAGNSSGSTSASSSGSTGANSSDNLANSLSSSADSYSGLGTEAMEYARLWHGAPVVGAGYSERFALYDDGSFVWGANDMDGATRVRWLAGTWDIKGGELILACMLAVLWEGGSEQDNSDGHMGSYASPTVITGQQTAVYRIDQVFSMPVSGITTDVQRGLDTADFGTLQCWDYTSQADAMLADFWQIINSARSKAPATPDKPAATLTL